jgi:hypothetical protein
MKKFWLLSVLLLTLTNINAQDISVRFETSYCMYSMNSLKAWQEDYIKSIGLPAKVVDAFPSYYGYGLSLEGRMHRNEYGIFFGYNSTAGRIDLQDYSGSFRSDQLLHCSTYGIFYQYQMNRSSTWRLFTSIHLSTVLSAMDINNSLQVGEIFYDSNVKMYAKSFGFRPGLNLRRELGVFSIYTAASYELQTQGNIYLNENNDPLSESDGTKVYTQWGGLRLSVGMGISLGKHE